MRIGILVNDCLIGALNLETIKKMTDKQKKQIRFSKDKLIKKYGKRNYNFVSKTILNSEPKFYLLIDGRIIIGNMHRLNNQHLPLLLEIYSLLKLREIGYKIKDIRDAKVGFQCLPIGMLDKENHFKPNIRNINRIRKADKKDGESLKIISFHVIREANKKIENKKILKEDKLKPQKSTYANL